jgi:hypothetical protein
METQNANDDKLNDLIGSVFISLLTASLSVVRAVTENLIKEKEEPCIPIMTTTASAPSVLLQKL